MIIEIQNEKNVRNLQEGDFVDISVGDRVEMKNSTHAVAKPLKFCVWEWILR